MRQSYIKGCQHKILWLQGVCWWRYYFSKIFLIMVGNSKSLSIVLKRHEEFIWNRLRWNSFYSYDHTYTLLLQRLIFAVFVAQNIFFFNSIDSNYEERQFEYCIMGNKFWFVLVQQHFLGNERRCIKALEISSHH